MDGVVVDALMNVIKIQAWEIHQLAQGLYSNQEMNREGGKIQKRDTR